MKRSQEILGNLALAGVFLLLVVIWSPGVLAKPTDKGLNVKYRMAVDFTDWKSRKIPGKMALHLVNEGAGVLDHLVLVLYPNRFLEELPNLNDLNFRWIYPDGFSKGSLDISGIRSERTGRIVSEFEESGNLPDRTVIRVPLHPPVKPGETRTLEMEFVLKVPEKFGSFGFYRDVLTLSGGWHPYVPVYDFEEGFQLDALPPKADWEIRFRHSSPLLVDGEFLDPDGKTRESVFKRNGIRRISLSMSDRFDQISVYGRHKEVRIFFPKEDPEAAKPVKELIVQWLEFVEKFPEFSGIGNRITLVQAPIRDSLVIHGQSMTYFSDRAFKILSALEQYHTIPIIRGLFHQLIENETSRRESSRNYFWVAEALSYFWTQRFVAEKKYQNMDARELAPIRALSFLPSIDRVIYTPQFAFVDVYYDLVYSYDPVRDDFLKFNHRRPQGRTVYANMEDELSSETVVQIADQYLSRKKQENRSGFIEITEETAGRSLANEFRQWTSPRPDVNYTLESHRQKKTEDGFEHEVRVLRESIQGFSEPVELLVVTEKGVEKILRWDDTKDHHLFRFKTASPVEILEIDPRRRLLESKLSDNRDPPYYKFVLTEFLVDYDFNRNRPSGFVSTQFRKSYGGANRYSLNALYTSTGYGGGLGYTRLFGRIIDRLRLSHALGVGFNFRRLEDDLALARDPNSNATQVVRVQPDANNTSLSIGYYFGNQLSYTNPLEGGGGGVSAVWGTKLLGGDSNYYQWTASGSWIYQMHPSHLLAFRALLGSSGPSGIPSRVQYTLGGISGMRGLTFDEDRFVGRNIFLTSAEYRHFLVQDLDINLWLFRIRDIQGALFGDAGRVTDTVQEKADLIAFGGTTRTDLADVFDVGEFELDAGYGVRIHVDYLGVNPGILRLDAAKSLTQKGQNVRFYFGVTQSF